MDVVLLGLLLDCSEVEAEDLPRDSVLTRVDTGDTCSDVCSEVTEGDLVNFRGEAGGDDVGEFSGSEVPEDAPEPADNAFIPTGRTGELPNVIADCALRSPSPARGDAVSGTEVGVGVVAVVAGLIPRPGIGVPGPVTDLSWFWSCLMSCMFCFSLIFAVICSSFNCCWSFFFSSSAVSHALALASSSLF